MSSCVEKRDLEENTLMVHLNMNPRSLHVTNDQTSAKHFIFTVVQKTLYKLDLRDNLVTPVLLQQLPTTSKDGLTYTFDLRQDVKWDDGSALTVEDVNFTIKLHLCKLTNNPNSREVYRGVVDSVRLDAEKPGRFHVVMKAVHIMNPSVFSEMYILQKKHWDPEGILDELNYQMIFSDDYKASPKMLAWFKGFNAKTNGTALDKINGLGPYRITEWNSQSIICEKKKNWWGEEDTLIYNQNNPDKIIFRMIETPDAAISAFRRGQLDFSYRMGTSSIKRLNHSSSFKENYDTRYEGQFAFTIIPLNNKPDGVKQKKLFDDKKVRLAMAYAIPTDEIIEVFWHGSATRQVANIFPSKSYYHKDLNPIPFDLKKAAELLEEAGWKDTDGDHILDKVIDGQKTPFSFKLMFFDAQPYTDVGLMICNELKKIGIDAQTDGKDVQNTVRCLQMHEFDACILSLVGDAKYNDPSQMWLSESWANHGFNFSGFGNANSDSLIRHINQQTDPMEYEKAIKQFQELLYEEQPVIFLFQQNKYVMLHKRFSHSGFYAEKPGAIIQDFRLNNGGLKSIE